MKVEMAMYHEEQLKELFKKTIYTEEYKYYRTYPFAETFSLPQDTEGSHDFVIIDDEYCGMDLEDDEVKIIAYVVYGINRSIWAVNCLGMVTFEDGYERSCMSGLREILKDIFEKFNFNKVNFNVVTANEKHMKQYDGITQMFGGRIIGTYEEECKLYDGQLYDIKVYEIMRRDYLKKKEKKNESNRNQ